MDRVWVGEKLRHLRTLAGVSLDEAATACGVTKSAVSQWEHGYRIPDVGQMQRLAEIEEIPFDTFLSELGYPVPIVSLTLRDWWARRKSTPSPEPSHSATAARLSPDAPGAPMRGSEPPPTARKPMLWGSSRPLAAAGLA